MRLRNGEHGYGVVTKTLHWLTVAAIIAQFAGGLTMGPDEAALEREDERIYALEERGEEAAESRGEAAEEAFEIEIDRLEDELKGREDDYVSDAFADGDRDARRAGAQTHRRSARPAAAVDALTYQARRSCTARTDHRSGTPLSSWLPR